MARRPPPDQLFDARSRELAAGHHPLGAFAGLVRDERPGGRALRAVLERAWQGAGDSRTALRAGLEHERWGQHAGALAHLLALAALDALGWVPRSEPRVGRRRPDLLVSAPGGRALVEVRSFSGGGQRPWEDEPARAARRAPPPEPGRPLDRRALRRLASQRAEARAANRRDLAEALDGVLRHKAGAYAEACDRTGLPLLLLLYGDTDAELPGRVRAWAAGLDGDDDTLDHVAAVLVLLRRETPDDGAAVTLDLEPVPLAGGPPWPDLPAPGPLRLSADG